jgi:hypothetical protein
VSAADGFEMRCAVFGTTTEGGTYRSGTAYRLTPGPNVYAQKVLYSFCVHGGRDCITGHG